jgi:dTDP-4-dehydrorhamnose reductase
MRILLFGHKGMLGSMLDLKLRQKGHEVLGFDLPEVDVTQPLKLEFLKKEHYDFVYNCAAFADVNRCESEYDKAYAVNATAVKNILAVIGNKPFLHVSTDYVFDGGATTPYSVDNPHAPISAYGRTKAAGEKIIFDSGHKEYFIVRTAWLYGPGGKNFVETMIALAQTKPEIRIVNDQRGSPTYTVDLAEAMLGFLNSKKYGIYHFTNKGETTWYNFAKTILDIMGSKTPVKPCTTAEYPTPAKRPAYSVLSLDKTEKELHISIPSWQDALARYIAARGK